VETGRLKRHALGVLGEHSICKKRWEPKHLKESLGVCGAHFHGEKGQSVKSSTISDVLKDSAKWLSVDVSSGGKFKFGKYTSCII
jgi:hypothetical protein